MREFDPAKDMGCKVKCKTTGATGWSYAYSVDPVVLFVNDKGHVQMRRADSVKVLPERGGLANALERRDQGGKVVEALQEFIGALYHIPLRIANGWSVHPWTIADALVDVIHDAEPQPPPRPGLAGLRAVESNRPERAQ